MDRSYDDYKKIIDEHLLDFIPNIDNKSITLYESMKYSLVAGGKRLRPVLLLAACDFAGGDIYEAVPYACAMEYIHTYSLIHDDLPAMDNDDLRRGLPTNHKVYGEAMAILAGDGLLTTAFEAIYKDMMLYFDEPDKMVKRVKAANEIAKGAGCRGMVAGQVSDIEGEGADFSNEMLEYIHINKTGALIRSSIKAGLYLGNPTSYMLDNLDHYAENLGLAYQIADDILDEVGDPSELGKATGSDKKKNKNTYTSINGLEAAYKRLDQLTDSAVEAIAPYYDNAEFFRDLVLQLKRRKK
ncbi:MAG: polyprenyl synthetase family protein [Firmicutes bacterium]|nr:polyprenyl synthetase family protein [Bacillota bacterium]MBR6584657.1 polyprenyl synthetase family protein [Bacillota bacterium]